MPRCVRGGRSGSLGGLVAGVQNMAKYADTLQQKISAYTKLSGELNGMNARQAYVPLAASQQSSLVSGSVRTV